MSDLQADLSCSCGKSVSVYAKDAGGVVTCICGRAVNVPRLSELRQLAGKDAYVTNPVEKIRKLQQQGIEPAGNACLICGSSTPVYYACHATCEASHLKKAGSDSPDSPWYLLGLFLFPKLLILPFLLSKDAKNAERVGHDITVDFSLPVCVPCISTIGNVARPSIAKKVMEHNILLKELAAYYPHMALKVESPPN